MSGCPKISPLGRVGLPLAGFSASPLSGAREGFSGFLGLPSRKGICPPLSGAAKQRNGSGPVAERQRSIIVSPDGCGFRLRRLAGAGARQRGNVPVTGAALTRPFVANELPAATFAGMQVKLRLREHFDGPDNHVDILESVTKDIEAMDAGGGNG